ncbi:NDP-hexose 2,3-dehydratase family protein [Geomobilimonas luticola]|nr:NDP-hexose 2,3-dehydratase family protein [Geomobilimonas luticola]
MNRENLHYDRGDELLGFDRQTMTDLLLSRVADVAFHSDSHVDDWIAGRLATPRLMANIIPLHAMARWRIERYSGNIRHDTGRFFSVIGVSAKHRTPTTQLEWDQPIIDQPEVGILGILAKRIDGVLHFCLHAKEEPGNINSVQLSPTVQATYSNYTCAHGGKTPLFVKYFLAPLPGGSTFAKLQTEDGGRFLYKSNRNMIVRIGDHELGELPDGYIWLTLRQIAGLLRRDNLIHACTRSILSALLLPDAEPLGSTDSTAMEQHRLTDSIADAVQWLDDQKAANHMLAQRKGLDTLKEWGMDGDGFFAHIDKRFFRIMGLEVTSEGREVSRWSQPILANPEPGIIGLLVRRRGNERQFLMQAKAEIGNRSVVQLAPTVQFTPGNYIGNMRLPKPFLFEEFSGSGRFPVLAETRQAEEGARFFREQHLHRILALPENGDLELPPDYRWLSESQIRFFLHLGESVNSCARSILACLL